MGGGAGGGALHVHMIDLPAIQFTTSSSPSPPSSSSSGYLNFPVSVNNSSAPLRLSPSSCSTPPCFSCPGGVCTRLLMLESERGKQDGIADRPSHNHLYGPVPAPFEVETAIASLQDFMQGISSNGSDLSQLQQMLDCSNVTTMLTHGYGRVREAFNLLQTDPSVKRLVVSLSSDKAVWNAVMNNEAVRELQQSAHKIRIQNCSDDEPDIRKRMLSWIVDMTKAKVGELIHKFQSLMNDVFQPLERDKRRESRDDMDDKVRSSLLLSIVILLIVVVTRAYRL